MKLPLKISNTARRGVKMIQLRTDTLTTNQKPESAKDKFLHR
jgi:hypothetical protein|tara:strand:- start:512 stop:637 length:126 start_codon:yes stop_codon:yes gene_type:complete